jgi:hypothetical protein
MTGRNGRHNYAEAGRTAFGAHLSNCEDCTLENLQISDLVGGTSGFGSDDSGENANADNGYAIGIYLQSSPGTAIKDCTISNVEGGTRVGGKGGGHDGGNAYGLRSYGAGALTITNNELSEIHGGHGSRTRTGYWGCKGGKGIGIELDCWGSTQGGTVTGNRASEISGGNGNGSRYGEASGDGGRVYGLRLMGGGPWTVEDFQVETLTPGIGSGDDVPLASYITQQKTGNAGWAYGIQVSGVADLNIYEVSLLDMRAAQGSGGLYSAGAGSSTWGMHLSSITNLSVDNVRIAKLQQGQGGELTNDSIFAPTLPRPWGRAMG